VNDASERINQKYLIKSKKNTEEQHTKAILLICKLTLFISRMKNFYPSHQSKSMRRGILALAFIRFIHYYFQ